MSRGAFAALLACALPAVTGCGDSGDGGDKKGGDPFKAVSEQPSQTRTDRQAAPRWARVARVSGTAPKVQAISIEKGAIQWRARWRCSRGRLNMTVDPAPRSAPEKAGGRCPDSGETTWVQTGDQRLRVAASGRWSVTIDQQVDTPINEAPLASMKSKRARVLLRGSFRDVERQGSGRVRIYRLPNGRLAVRLDPFRTSANTDLFLWLSTAARPKTTRDIVRAKRVGRLIPLKSTIGPQNYRLPRGINTRRIRSLAIWCEPIRIVYTLAFLRR